MVDSTATVLVASVLSKSFGLVRLILSLSRRKGLLTKYSLTITGTKLCSIIESIRNLDEEYDSLPLKDGLDE